MGKANTPFKYDYVGSFLRPESLKVARRDFENKKITAEELKAVEDKAIIDLVEKQKKAGYQVITDGEFRRATWQLDFMWGFNGVAHKPSKNPINFHATKTDLEDTYLVDKITVDKHPFVEHFKFIKALEDENTVAKQTIPAPAQFLLQCVFEENLAATKAIYPETEDLIEDLGKAYQKVIGDLYEAGCRNLQIDDCSWGLFFGQDLTKESEAFAKQLLKANNLAIAKVPSDMVVNTHICRGNYNSDYFSQGAYDSVAKIIFGEENVNAYYLEFDDERSGSFAPLKEVSGDKKVVLGLITTKKPELENKEEVIARIHEAAKYIPLERLCLSPQCGFASCEIGNKLTEEEQWAKLALVKEIAEEVWG
ncbi:MAG TPA: 5-methyltetrahydropteroyltriglutamate--homocysteine S-methyltransferase [Candidatus Dorea intestinavium]|nr:5-methyltetrahydropteroyltriglutamate--homocysteine S-methyltransferase [Candidatus Dorea intestinavium]